MAAGLPFLYKSPAGGLTLACLAAWGWLFASWEQRRRFRLDLARAARDLESAPREGFSRWVEQEAWGELSELAPSANWLFQEAQAIEKAGEARLADETARLKALVHALPDGVLMASPRGDVLYMNAPAARMLGLPTGVAASGRGLRELIGQESLRGALTRILEKRARQDAVELVVEGEGGASPRTLASTVQVVANPDDVDVSVLVTLRDVTTERELDRMKGEFFQAVAHDLRAPLLGLQGYARLLEKAQPGGERERGFYRAIHQSCDRIHAFIQDILDLSRMEAGGPVLELSSVGPVQLLGKVHAYLRPLAEEKGVELVLELPAEEPAPLKADERLLERALSNLVQNALKFTPQGGRVGLGLEAKPEGFLFYVADTGPGLAVEDLAHVFDKFRPLSGPRREGGFGLGLTIAKSAVEAHGGRIWAESKPGQGCRFSFTLPRARAVESGIAAGYDPRD